MFMRLSKYSPERVSIFHLRERLCEHYPYIFQLDIFLIYFICLSFMNGSNNFLRILHLRDKNSLNLHLLIIRFSSPYEINYTTYGNMMESRQHWKYKQYKSKTNYFFIILMFNIKQLKCINIMP